MEEKKPKRMRKVLVLLVILALAGLALPVSNLLVAKPHSPKLAAVPCQDGSLTAVRDALQAKCSHCHTDDAGLPFYAALPGAGGIIRGDVERALRYLDLPASFEAADGRIGEVALAKMEHALAHNTMPPVQYLAMHWDSALSGEERQKLTDWVVQTRVKQYAAKDLDEKLARQVIHPLPQAHKEDAARVAMGEKLFNDTRLSKDGTLSCASCHGLDKGGTDQAPVATGVGGAKGPINSPTVFNALYNVKQFWDGRAADLKDQAAGPVENPIEMAEKWDNVVQKLQQDAAFKAEFEKLYPAGVSKDTVTEAIATFEKTLITPDSRFDKFLRGDQAALTAGEKEGYQLFLDNGCATCHCGPALGGRSFEWMGRHKDYFTARGNVKEADHGLFNFTKKEADRYKFKTPTLRNIEVTFPYFHDASAKDLQAAVKVMADVQYGKALSQAEIDRIVDFLKTLTGEYKGKSLAKAK
ncbi:MAG: Cytochrome c551 peroxidase precursor [Planctomycetes bacterium ADurb.Bin126]|nr:MAG: Cytochrome c551 peroxidase precursor [Planctomycetes bacterium ADurb.Bin126]HQL72648.1 cytochrome c peroxidase [Phycisphaerae bacterium]